MAQGFDCFCGTTNCRGSISGAKNMSAEQLEGMWLNAHIRELLEERNGDSEEIESGGPGAWSEHGKAGGGGDIVNPLLLVSRNGTVEAGAVTGKEGAEGGVIKDATEAALRASLEQARKMVEAAQKALHTYKSIHGFSGPNKRKDGKGASVRENGVGSRELSGEMGGDTRQGVTSRELSGEMGGDTLVDV
jgi:hypothetical protein